MADILSQDEIDALLSSTEEDEISKRLKAAGVADSVVRELRKEIAKLQAQTSSADELGARLPEAVGKVISDGAKVEAVLAQVGDWLIEIKMLAEMEKENKESGENVEQKQKIITSYIRDRLKV